MIMFNGSFYNSYVLDLYRNCYQNSDVVFNVFHNNNMPM